MQNKGSIKGYIVVKQPGEEATVEVVPFRDLTLRDMQERVGGYIERVPFVLGTGMDLWCNEEGRILEMAPNLYLTGGAVIVGPVLAVERVAGEDSVESWPFRQREQAEAVARILCDLGERP